MIGAIQNIVSSPVLHNATESTVSQMAIKTSLNAIGRPGFILMDKDIDSHTKKFSATKEFLYQLISLGLYLGLIMPVFKRGTYSLARKLCKDDVVFKAFKTPDEFKKFYKLGSEQEKINKLSQISQATGDTFNRSNVTVESENFANGVVETSSLVGTIIGMAIIAPLTATKLIHPIMKTLGMDKNKAKQLVDDAN